MLADPYMHHRSIGNRLFLAEKHENLVRKRTITLVPARYFDMPVAELGINNRVITHTCPHILCDPELIRRCLNGEIGHSIDNSIRHRCGPGKFVFYESVVFMCTPNGLGDVFILLGSYPGSVDFDRFDGPIKMIHVDVSSMHVNDLIDEELIFLRLPRRSKTLTV